jgi:general secretion pathway protein G
MVPFLNRFYSQFAMALRETRGVTLLEVLIVLVILGLLASLGSIQLMSVLGRAKSETARLQIRELSAALDLFRIDVNRSPSEAEGLAALVENVSGIPKWNGPYLKSSKSLSDPWGRHYRYRLMDSGRDFEIMTFGADGKIGGGGEDADISSTELQ